MQYDKKVIDINTHPYLFEDVCRTQEQYQLVYDVTGLYHNGVASMPSTFARLDCAKIDLCVLSPLDLTTTKGTWMDDKRGRRSSLQKISRTVSWVCKRGSASSRRCRGIGEGVYRAEASGRTSVPGAAGVFAG